MNEHIVWPRAGKYVVAVSGGADSMALLALLAGSERDYELVVAHYDHGLRAASERDAALVEEAAGQYGLAYQTERGELGKASEAVARTARHAFLERVRVATGAQAITTAHHQDDLIETSLLNLARGADGRGLAPMQDGAILRPLLKVTRLELRRYAHEQGLRWHEDPTNADLANPRNFLRHELIAGADEAWRGRYLEIIARVAAANRTVDGLIEPYLLSNYPETLALDRLTVRDLSLDELQAVIAAASRQLSPDIELEERLVQELALFAKTGRPGTRRPVRIGIELSIKRHEVVISTK